MVLYVFIEPFNVSFFNITGQGIGLGYVMLNGLPWKWTKITLSFWGLHSSTAFQTLVHYNGCSISSKGFLPTGVDRVVIWAKFTFFSPFISLIAKMSMYTLAISFPFTLMNGMKRQKDRVLKDELPFTRGLFWMCEFPKECHSSFSLRPFIVCCVYLPVLFFQGISRFAFPLEFLWNVCSAFPACGPNYTEERQVI